MLIVEDNESDVFLIEEALHGTRLPLTLNIVTDGDQAVRFVDRAEDDPALPCPSLVILDINLPKRQGTEVLRYIRQSRRCANIPVIAVSTSDSGRDRDQMATLGANGYFRKPSEYDDFMKLGDLVKAMLDTTTSTR